MNPPILGFLFFIGKNYKVMNYFDLPAPALGMIVIVIGAIWVSSAFAPLTSKLVKINVPIKKAAKKLGAVVYMAMAVQFISLAYPEPMGSYIELWGMDITLPLAAGIITALLYLDFKEDDIFEMLFTAILYGAVVLGSTLLFVHYFFAPQRGLFMAVVGAVIYGSLAHKMRDNILYRAY